MQEAILSAEIALQCPINQSVLEEATELLAAQATERANRVGVALLVAIVGVFPFHLCVYFRCVEQACG